MKNVILFLILLSLSFSYAQDDTTNLVNKPWVQVVLNNGKTFIAKVISDDGRELFIDTKEIGKLYVKKADVRIIKEIKDEKNIVYGELREEGAFTTRYFLTPNALPVKKGENYAYIHLAGPEMHFAVTDKTSIGVFTSWIAAPFGLVLKHNLKTKNEKLNFSIGALAATSTYINSFKGFGGLAFASGTYGSRMNNVSVSLGYSLFYSGYYKSYKVDLYDNLYNYTYNNYSVDHRKAPSHALLSSIAGIFKISAKTSFFFELWFTASSNTKPKDIQNVSNVDLSEYYQNYYDDFDDPFNIVFSKLHSSPQNKEAKEIQSYIRYTVMFFPGIRILLQNEKAFQITLGSVHHIDDGKSKSFPLPMLSWFKKF
ncbi:MAG: hypothetical protein HYU67_08620 [Flavobacteriia bacterium]|nr:hypothetical protein [Flavobacteriia bacterium]